MNITENTGSAVWYSFNIQRARESSPRGPISSRRLKGELFVRSAIRALSRSSNRALSHFRYLTFDVR
jgi:hypothetical protein